MIGAIAAHIGSSSTPSTRGGASTRTAATDRSESVAGSVAAAPIAAPADPTAKVTGRSCRYEDRGMERQGEC